MTRAQMLIGVLAALVFGAAVVAAGTMESAGTTTAAAHTANFADAVSRTLGTRSARFTDTVTVSGRDVLTVVGVLDFADGSLEYDARGFEVRFIGTRSYVHGLHVTLPHGASWVTGSASSHFSVVALRGATKIKVVGSPRINGVDLTEYSVTLGKATVKVWVDGSKHIRQIEWPGELTKLSAFGKAPPVSAPPADQVVDIRVVPGGIAALEKAFAL